MADAGAPGPSLAVLLGLVERRTALLVEAALESVGMARRHLGALGHLRREPGLSVSELARRAGVTPQSMHATVGELERDGLVARGDTGRGRRAGLVVTDLGARRLTEGMRAVEAVDADLRAELGAAAYDAMVAAAARLLEAGSDDRSAPT